jgi:hypothetical protein
MIVQTFYDIAAFRAKYYYFSLGLTLGALLFCWAFVGLVSLVFGKRR